MVLFANKTKSNQIEHLIKTSFFNRISKLSLNCFVRLRIKNSNENKIIYFASNKSWSNVARENSYRNLSKRHRLFFFRAIISPRQKISVVSEQTWELYHIYSLSHSLLHPNHHPITLFTKPIFITLFPFLLSPQSFDSKRWLLEGIQPTPNRTSIYSWTKTVSLRTWMVISTTYLSSTIPCGTQSLPGVNHGQLHLLE
ncbi:Uncharacterized protein TCM_004348 isoform 1 [Theobroma cacao]|uniref:Uncharacterized protein isoform 1 n=1 Tax=Theobroma cacao TaxID=3641 RepID=A0A061DXM0_THECC|nr:Uncharacterized protein TCM_004348 isoform 1 [Theobroma cacao]